MAKTTNAASNFDALFGARGGETVVSGGFKMIPHERIVVHPQVRQTFAPAELKELGSSIRELKARGQGIEGSGVLQALLVCPEGDGYRLLAGEKRFRATQAEKLAAVPCVIVAAPQAEGTVRLLQLTENLLRSDPPVLEEARAFAETMEAEKLSMRDLARALGKTLGYVSNRTALLKMREEVQAMVGQRGDTLRVAAHINKVEDDTGRVALIQSVIEEGISEREVLRRIAGEGEAQVFSRENSDGAASADAKAGEGEVFSRENGNSIASDDTNAGETRSTRAKTEKSSEGAAPSLRGAVRATTDAIERIRSSVLSDDERQKVRADRDALASLLEELDEIIG